MRSGLQSFYNRYLYLFYACFMLTTEAYPLTNFEKYSILDVSIDMSYISEVLDMPLNIHCFMNPIKCL